MNGRADQFSLAWMLAWREFRGRYLTSSAGIFWAVLSPALYAAIFVLFRGAAQRQGLHVDTGGVPPALFAFFGLVLWQVWIESVLSQTGFLRRASPILRSLRIDVEVFFLSSLLVSFLDTTVRILLLVVVMAFVPASFGPYAPLFPLAAFVLVFTGNALGLILAFPGSFFQDVQKTIQSISLGILLATPIFYTAASDAASPLYWLQIANPLACTLVTARDLAFGGPLLFLGATVAWFAALFMAMLAMLAIYRVTVPLIVERL